jgi:hypothetical protein
LIPALMKRMGECGLVRAAVALEVQSTGVTVGRAPAVMVRIGVLVEAAFRR